MICVIMCQLQMKNEIRKTGDFSARKLIIIVLYVWIYYNMLLRFNCILNLLLFTLFELSVIKYIVL